MTVYHASRRTEKQPSSSYFIWRSSDISEHCLLTVWLMLRYEKKSNLCYKLIGPLNTL